LIARTILEEKLETEKEPTDHTKVKPTKNRKRKEKNGD
jgi:hypothetical protein